MKKLFINGKEVEFNQEPFNCHQSKYLIVPEERIEDLIKFLQDFKKTEGNKGFLAIKGIEKDFDILDDKPVIADMSFNGTDFGICYFNLETK